MPQLEITPSDIATIVTVNEARISQGLGTLRLDTGAEDPEGNLTIAEYKARHSAVVAEASAASEGAATDGGQPAQPEARQPDPTK